MLFSNKLLFVIYTLSVLLLSILVPIWFAFILLLIFFSFVFSSKTTKAFLLGFASVFCAWIILMLFKDFQNDSLLSTRITHLFKLPSKWILLILTALIGGILGALSTWLGKNLKSSFGYIK